LTAHGRAGHASLPRTGDNALLKLGWVLTKIAQAEPTFALTDGPAALLAGLGFDPQDPAIALARLNELDPALTVLVEPMLGVTLTPTMSQASQKVNVIPSRASIKVDCRVPPGLGEDAARERIRAVLGELGDEFSIEFNETVVGNQSSLDTPLMAAIDSWVIEHDPGAKTVPVILPGFSDSRWWRDAFPDCIAYGFFPQRYQSLLEAGPLVHNADERIDVRDLGFAARCYTDITRELLG
jgi:acetylornithine deacetylase/succinyl-diaminopimelate desuccinylase-like protein